MARSLVRGSPRRAVCAFDPAGSYAATFVAQGADRALAQGLLDRPLTDESFFTALGDAPRAGLDVGHEVRRLKRPDHPNQVEIDLVARDGTTLQVEDRSIGGGEVELTRVAGLPVLFNGSAYETVLLTSSDQAAPAVQALGRDGGLLEEPVVAAHEGHVEVCARRARALAPDDRSALERLAVDAWVFESEPVYFIPTGSPLFSSAAEMVGLAQEHGLSLGRVALEYEARLLNMPATSVIREILRRYEILENAVARGLEPGFGGTQLIEPTAGAVFRAEGAGRLTLRSAHARAAARAMAVMHVDGAMGVVCAAPTGGSAGVIPGALITLAEERRLTSEQVALALLAAGAIGVVVARRATFAAEVAGCQVEIGAAGAMAAAAVVDAVGGAASRPPTPPQLPSRTRWAWCVTWCRGWSRSPATRGTPSPPPTPSSTPT
jgi:L-serine dehydratase